MFFGLFRTNKNPAVAEPSVLVPVEKVEEQVEDTDGLREWNDDKGVEKIVDFVFVHGLTGDALGTWSAKPGSFWPLRLLQEDIPSARIMTYGYNSAIAKIRGGVSQNTLTKHAEGLAYELALFRNADDTADRPLIFVCHSLGGLLVESVVSFLRSEEASQVSKATYAIAFFGTPHCGSSKAEYAHALRLLVKPLNNNPRLLEAMARDSEILFNIENSFHHYLETAVSPLSGRVEVCSYFEEFEYHGVIGKIVPDESAIIKGRPFKGIAADHVGMAKFSDKREPGYRAVSLQLSAWVRQVQRKQGC